MLSFVNIKWKLKYLDRF